MTILDFYEGRCVKFSTNVSLSANDKKKGGAIKGFLFGSKSWLKEVGSVLPYRQNCAISSDETFVSMSPKVRG